MTDSQFSLHAQCANLYAQAYAYHGDLNLDETVFSLRVQQIVEQQLPAGADAEATCTLVERLYGNDVYLTCACAVPTDAAWERLLLLYRRRIIDLSCYACGTADLGEEVADLVLTQMYLPDRQGRSHIAAFDGRIPLGAWLRVIVIHQAYKECKRKCNQFTSLAEVPEFLDPLADVRLEAMLRDHTYRELVNRGLQHACRQLSERERLILLLRYEDDLQGAEIASLLEVAPSTVSRALRSAQQKLKAALMDFLAAEWDGHRPKMDECLTDLLANPTYSLLTLLKETSLK